LQVIKIPVQLKSDNNSPLIQFGLPISLGVLKSLKQLSIELNGVPIEASAQVTSHWNDNSIKSCLVNLYLACSHIDKLEVIIVSYSDLELTPVEDIFALNIGRQAIKLQTQNLQFSYDMISSNFELKHINQTTTQLGTFNLKDALGTQLVPSSLNYQIVKKQSLLTLQNSDLEIIIDGEYVDQQKQVPCLFKITFAFYKDGELLNIQLNIHNPKAAEHNMGLWDLGDPNSFTFNSLAVKLDFIESENIRYSTHLNDENTVAIEKSVRITQHASGGENWQSPVHIDHTGKVPFRKNGFVVYQQQQVITSGTRATPTLYVANKLQLTQPHFWQNFPSALVLNEKNITFEFFPEQDQSYELQGGEKKTHGIWLSTIESDNLAWVHTKQSVKLPDTWLSQTSLGQLMSFVQLPSAWQELINNGLDSEQNFFNKRENLDEFGWRNFGDLYADHETAEHTGKDIFVSHYNNQYDPIYGFLKQYLVSGNAKWFELADDLAKHVIDIDIYHTTEDKDEYNGGLFWHTDHYLQAYTSSHRSYSKHQPSDAYQDHAGGGGPGGQHCYTTGLMVHYLLTAHEPSKDAVLSLTHWISNVYEGSGTCLELLLAFKNRQVPGFKNHFSGQYPLDRGTANYVVALLDSYELTNNIEYLTRAEQVLLFSFHPDEDINNRNLQDVENTWFYTVFLQAVCRYLGIKERLHQLDEPFYYCRDSLLNFTRWMTIFEVPYLTNPDILEYPNDTWTGQDLRKVHIFAAAYYYSSKSNQVYLDRALYFENDILNRLNSSSTKTYTRIMALVLQNHGALDFYKNKTNISSFKCPKFVWPRAHYEGKLVLLTFLTLMLNRISKFSLMNEVNWLKKRLKK
jgi:hypothetical protein